MSGHDYSVYLVEHGDSGGEREVTSPVRGSELDFYDTGVWLSRERGRNFFPYEQIRTIREHPEGQRSEGERPEEEAESEGAGEQPAAAESSAEEEMVE